MASEDDDDNERPEEAITMNIPDDGHQNKKARFMSTWEKLIHDRDPSQSRFGLVSLFGSGRNSHNMKTSSSGSGEQQNKTCPQHINNNHRINEKKEEALPNFTFRMEHREGGAIAQHHGEERILVFRSDQPGAIAKVIYSSNPASEEVGDENIAPPETEDEDFLNKMAQAKVHVLSVKEAYRGFDLGGLLFHEAMNSLKQRYKGDVVTSTSSSSSRNENMDLDKNQGTPISQSIRCQLDAEEDIRRHNKLVGFYEQLGCRVKPKAKISYLNNNDGETYRKIPMQIALRPESKRTTSCDEKSFGTKLSDPSSFSLVDRQGGFLPIVVLEAPGKRVGLSTSDTHQNNMNTRIDWLVVETLEGSLEFRTTKGSTLRVSLDGQCTVAADDNTTNEMSKHSSKFHLLRVSDAQQRILQGEEDDDDSSVELASKDARKKELWIFQSSHGSFLAVDPHSHNLRCSKEPAFWQADDNAFSITLTTDTPLRRQHYRRMWSKQTVQYVQTMQERYCGFNLQKMSFKKALHLAKDIPGNPFSLIGGTHLNPSVRTLCYQTAEIARAAGLPDWIQLIALVHALAGVVTCIDSKTAAESEVDYDWTLCSRSRVVGCAAPSDITFGEFRSLNADEQDVRYKTPLGIYHPHCGLENVLLTWNGSNYMYNMFKHNSVGIPDEGYQILRLFAFYDWHTNYHYDILANDDDLDVRPFVLDFYEIRKHALLRTFGHCKSELSDDECDYLWNTHYSHILHKYEAGGLLDW